MFILKKQKKIDAIYVEGPGNIVESLRRWHQKEEYTSETALTFSGQVFDFFDKNQFNSIAISHYPEIKKIQFDRFLAFSKPKNFFSGGIGYHLSQVIYGMYILRICLKYRPTYLHVTNGVTHWFALAPLKLLGIKVFPHLHNTFWAKGYPTKGKIKSTLLKLDALFLTRIASGVFCCSPEIERQVAEITNGKSCPTYLFKAQFNRASFTPPPSPKLHEVKPFTVVFAGRVERDKGVFDILEMAKLLRNNQVNFHICGDGDALIELREKCSEDNLDDIVTIHGRLDRQSLIKVYTLAHAVIVPTRSNFAEGFAMVAAEAVLLNRPVITSSIVPALELLRTAAVEANPEDVNSFANAIKQLMTDKSLFEQKQDACLALREQFLDNRSGLSSMLEHSLNE